MGLSARRSRSLRARSRAAVSLAVIAAWFGTLLVAAPVSSPAAAADPPPAAPSLATSPGAVGNDASPTWTITVPADTSDPQPPVFSGSDTSTATITITHTPECGISGDASAPSFVACTPAGAGTFTFTPSPDLQTPETGNTYTFYAHDVVTTTTTTVVEDDAGNQTTLGPTVDSGPTPGDDLTDTYLFDSVAPTVTLVGPPPTGPSATDGWVGTPSEPGLAVTCVMALTGGGSPVTGPCGPGQVFPGGPVADGSYTITATTTDAAGNSGTASTTYDQAAPVVTITGPSGIGNDTTPDWTASAGGPQVDCSLTRDGTALPLLDARCDQTAYPAGGLGADGVYVVTAKAAGPAGSIGTASKTYTLDTRKPVITVSAPDATTPTRPTWSVSSDEATAVPQCQLTGTVAVSGAAYASSTTACGATYTAPVDLAEGTYKLTATGTDSAGNTGMGESPYTYDIAPGAPTVDLPVTTGNGPTATWIVSSQAGAAITCTVTDETNATIATPTCASGQNVSVTVTLAAGPNIQHQYVLHAFATDGGGTSATTDSVPYLLDRVPPPTPTFGAGSSGSQNTPGVSWPFTATGGAVTCQLVQGPGTGTAGTAAPCTSPYSLNVAPGEWWVRVTVTDAAGNTSSADSTHVIYDNSPPSAPTLSRITSSPTNNPATNWTIGTTETSGYTLLCTWTGPVNVAEGTCGAPYFTLPATNGTYTLSVVVRDAAGNRSTPTTGTVLFDDIAPVVTFTNPPTTPRKNPTVTWTTTLTETGSGSVKTECRLMKRSAGPDDEIEAWTTTGCGRLVTRTLTAGDGLYYLQVRDTDAADNVNPNGTSSVDVELDTTAPGAPTISGSQGFSQNPNASWTVSPPPSADPTAVYDCRLIKDNVTAGTTWVPCDSDGDPNNNGIVFATTLATDGTYVVEVVARDPAGNLSTPVAASAPYTLDRVKPAAPVVSTSSYESNNTAPVWTITGEANATFTCTWTTTITPTPTGMPSDGACINGYSVTLPADGLYTLHVTQTDQALNTSATSTDKDYLLDTQAPAEPVVTGPVGPAKTTAVQYSFTSEARSTAECRLAYVAGLSAGSPLPVTAWSSCTSAWPVTLTQGDGRYRAEVRLTDVAGNVSTTGMSSIYVLDTTPPLAPTFATQPTGTAKNPDVTWTWTGETPTTGVCRLLFTPVGGTTSSVVQGPVACDNQTYSTTLTSGDGFYQLTVRLTDPSLNAGALATSTGYTLDTTPPPAPTVSGPTGTSNKTAADYALVGPIEAASTAECKLTRDATVVVSDWGACTMPRTITLSGDGSYVLQVRLTDQYGNTGNAGASPAYLLDTKLPNVPVVTAPASPSSNGAPVFTFTTDRDTKTTCRVMRGSVVAVDTTPCTSGYTAPLAGQPDGDYVLSVTATDPATNTATGSSAPYTYDTTAPVAPVVTGPAGPSQLRNPVFTWTGEAGARPECSLQEKLGAPGPFGACASPYAPTLSADGSWVLSVRLVDAAGNVSAVGSSGAYLLDTTAPATPVVTAPPSPGRDLAPSWSATIEEGSHADCRLTGPGLLGGWAPCTLPMTTAIRGDGTYTFEVRSTDAAGNVSPIGSATYLLDTTAPGAPVVVQPTSPSRNRTPSVVFSAETGTTGSCRLTRGSTVLSDSAPCSSPTTLNLSGLTDGAYTLSVRAVDAAGNIGPAGTATYVLDTTAPAVPTMTLVAGSPSSDRAPQFGFNVELGTTPSCKVTLPSGAVRDLTCTNTVTLDLSGASDGDYVLNVRTTDPAGNVSAPATTTYHLDSSAPVAPRVVGPATPGSNRNPIWKISSSSPAECRVLRGTTVFKDWSACGTSYSLDLFAQPDAVYILEARVVGTTAATMSRYRLDTSGPAAATIVGPPSPSTDRKPTWAVSSPDTTVHAECRVMVFTGVLKDWAPCAVSPAGSLFALDLTGLGDGTYSLLVRLTDAAGNLGPTAQSDYVLDTSAPAAVGVIAPLSPGNDTTPTWTLTSATGVKLECRLSSGQKVISDFAPCTGEFTADLTGLPDGTYTLTVHALSSAGTPGPETTSSYILDTTAAGAPGTLTGPTGPSRNRAPTWTFSLAPGTTAVCTVTFGGKVFRDGPCTSPFTLDLSNAADGTYKLTVRAVDAAGNLGAPSTAGYILKTTPPPAPTLTMQPGSPSSTTDPTWGFSLARGTTAQCRLLQSGSALEDWTPCGTAGATNGTVTALLSGKPDGRYTMQVRAVDEAQNTSAAVAGDYVFDRSAAPLAIFVDTPPTPGNDLTPTWVVAAPPADTTPTPPTTGTAALVRAAALTGTPQTECRLTTPSGVGTWATCSGKYVAKTNGDGTYLLEVRAFDTAGERGPASSSAYLLDTKAPAAPRLVDPMPPAVGNDAEVVWSWADDGNLVQCRLLRNGSALGGFTACDLLYVANVGRLGEATYTIEARAVDAAGNVSAVTSDSYRYDITPPAAPVFVTRPPARGSASSVTWTFGVPLDTHAVCVVTRNGTVISEGACAGGFTLDLRGQQPATWVLSVHLVDSAGNAGPATSGSYALLSAIGRSRVSGPPVNGPDAAPGGSGPGGSGPGVAGPSKTPPGIDREQPRAGGVLHVPPVVKKTIKQVARVTNGVVGAVPGTDVPKAIKNVLGQTITKPQLPLALFVIVFLFLLVQNRIDRRDPKLAVAPANAEPELTFGPILRPGGATA